VPTRLFVSGGGGGKAGEGQTGGSVLETLLNLLLSEKAGINIQENAAASKPLEDFIRQFTGGGAAANDGQTKKASAGSEPGASSAGAKKSVS
jgi:hypothetical protein